MPEVRSHHRLNCLCVVAGHRHPWCSVHGANMVMDPDDPLRDCYVMDEWVKWKVEFVDGMTISFFREKDA